MHPTNMFFDARVDGAQKIAMMDSGSSQVFISRALAKQLKLQTTQLRLQVRAANIRLMVNQQLLFQLQAA